MGKGNLQTTIPIHANRYIGKGLLAEIERQTGEKLRLTYDILRNLFLIKKKIIF
jgi:hypothetical protein